MYLLGAVKRYSKVDIITPLWYGEGAVGYD